MSSSIVARYLAIQSDPELLAKGELRELSRLRPLREASADMHCVWVSLKDYQTVWKRLGYRAKLWQTHGQGADNGRAHDIRTPDPTGKAGLLMVARQRRFEREFVFHGRPLMADGV